MKKKFLLRMNPELFEALNRWAADDMRSVNAQIEYLLHQAVAVRRKGIKGTEAGAEGGPVKRGRSAAEE